MQKAKSKITTKELVLTALSIALITVGAFIKVTIFAIPLTFQLMFVMLVALTFGYKIGVISTSLYAIMGLAGLPVFAKGGGIGYIATPSFGYILGFILAAFFIGFFAGPNKIKNNYPIMKTAIITIIGLILVYIVGVFYWYLLDSFILKTSKYSFLKIVEIGAISFMPKDIFLCFVVSLTAPKLQKIIR